ncbi:MAG: 30S ribosomal protein S9 [Mariprofundaceae bacterium]|nr:30S ribosomal protein S9 [Mariprofundaceae bacterium]
MTEESKYLGTGRRKRSVARVTIKPGSGNITINSRTAQDYFPVDIIRQQAFSPLDTAELQGRFDITILVNGGGVSGQAGAVRHGLSRALITYDIALRPSLKSVGFLRRDPRKIERKKAGLKKARKAPQYSKR